MKPAWTPILLTTLMGAGQGLFLAMAWIAFLGPAPAAFFVGGSALALALLGAGIGAAGRWISWRSRAVIPLPAFMVVLASFGAVHAAALERALALAITGIGVALCVALFALAASICARQGFLDRWHPVLAPVNFALLGTASGFTLAVPLAVLSHPRFAGPLALAAFALAAAAWVVRGPSLVREARLHCGPGGGLRAARWASAVLLFPAPGWLLGWGGGTLAAYAAAFALQFAGLLAERWSFFAGASPGRHRM